ncbi:MAG: (S)-2-hydroxyglutarate dehydrogenase [Solirubrobacterales bacterium]|jgi:2-hydroxyglutarate dehydrogenase|nr:(S)-2-hydroxyglutarate dehydrogenase [Solirubrobacterales bacterium]
MPAELASATEPPRECDVVVVGGGIVGLATARELARRHDGIGIVVLEREAGIGEHQTSHSSGVIHAGIYYTPGSLKARLCVEGARDLYAYCDEHGIPAERAGKVIVATEEDELGRLDELEHRGRENEVPGLARIGPQELREIEPHAAGIAALHSPNTGVVDFARVAAGYAADLAERGGSVFTGCGVERVDVADGRIAVEHARGRTRARAAVLCAGAWSDRLAVQAGADPEPRIVPFRGGYLKLRPERRSLVRSAIYPVPDPDLPFLGTHFTRTIDGDVLLGPSALMVAARDAYRIGKVRPRDIGQTLGWGGTWRLMARHWRYGLAEMRAAASNRAFVSALRRFVPELSAADVVAGPAGIRAQALSRDGKLVDDFVVSRTERALHVRNAPSPAATSSLALARLIADRAEAELDLG